MSLDFLLVMMTAVAFSFVACFLARTYLDLSVGEKKAFEFSTDQPPEKLFVSSVQLMLECLFLDLLNLDTIPLSRAAPHCTHLFSLEQSDSSRLKNSKESGCNFHFTSGNYGRYCCPA